MDLLNNLCGQWLLRLRTAALRSLPAALRAPGRHQLVRKRFLPKLGGKLPPRTARLAVPPLFNRTVPARRMADSLYGPAGFASVTEWKGFVGMPSATKDEQPVPVTIAALTLKVNALAGESFTFLERLTPVSGNKKVSEEIF